MVIRRELAFWLIVCTRSSKAMVDGFGQAG